MINKPREEAGQFYTNNKVTSHEALNASKLGYSVAHSMDLYDEVITGISEEKNYILFSVLRFDYADDKIYNKLSTTQQN